ncbi:oligosaccharide flippase family protein [Sphingomonas sp. LY29]|uniref:oligosaccharide flippase family protein n=1 Tax=Sphingomonas sp. LY29 TaxID=3095341 RepID=UPI002D77BCF0|nr:oligosaccharide flippase family protein [Sphingomonas sp. LY29]WRP26341.1 oligosaccharide flippase family protein [Sphingomonas sp. LY29]
MIRNVGVTSALNIYRAIVQFALNIVLAQFLMPSEFGQVAFVLPITLFILVLGEFGITAAIVRGAASREEAGAAAAICLSYGALLLAAVMSLRALGAFDGWPGEARNLVPAFGLVALIAMGAIVPRAMMERALAYVPIAKIETVANGTAFVAAVGSAWAGAGVWSFAVYHLAMQSIRTALFWWHGGGNIQFNLHWRRASALMRFGGWVVAFNVVNYCARNLDNYIVGGLLGESALGLYALGYQIMLVPLMAISWPATSILLSTLSRLRDRPTLQRESFLAMVGLAATVTFPIMTLVAFHGGYVFSLFLPERWNGIAPVISSLAIAGGLQSTTSFVGALFIMQNRVREQFWLGAGATLATLATVGAAAWSFGTLAAATGAYVIVTLVLSVVYYAIMARLISVSPKRIASALCEGMLISATASVTMLAARATLPSDMPRLYGALIEMLSFGAMMLTLLVLRRSRVAGALAALRRAGIEASA